MILDTASTAIACDDRLRFCNLPVLAEQAGQDGRHMVVGEVGAPHRLWLRRGQPSEIFEAVIPCDGAMETRIEAVADLARAGRRERLAASWRPTAYQSQRLILLLAILDLRQDRATSHEIAQRLVYPHMTIGRGAVWKSSPERRRTQRLVREADALAAGGYRALLAGRQK